MSKFEVMLTENVQRSVQYTVNITKKEVVDALGLEGDDAKEWRGHVQDYVEQEWDSIKDRAEQGDVDAEDLQSVDIDSVTDLSEGE